MVHGRWSVVINTVANTETEKSSFWWNVHHWLHWKLSKWQLPVQPVMKISSKWRHFCFSEQWKGHPNAIYYMYHRYQIYCFIYSSLYWIRPCMLQCCKFHHIPTSNKRVGHHFHAVVSNKILIIIPTAMAVIIEKNYDQQKLISRFTGSFAVCLRARRVRNCEVVCIDGVFYAYRLRLYKLNHITRVNHALYASNQRTIYLIYIRTILFYLDYKNNSL